jgi:hypothetical protein
MEPDRGPEASSREGPASQSMARQGLVSAQDGPPRGGLLTSGPPLYYLRSEPTRIWSWKNMRRKNLAMRSTDGLKGGLIGGAKMEIPGKDVCEDPRGFEVEL